MKRILLLATLASSVALSAFAQSSGTYPTSLNGGTNLLAAASTNSYAIVQGCGDFDHVGLQVTFKAVGAGTGTIQLDIARTKDGATYESVPSISYQIPLTGTTGDTITYCADITTASDLALKIVDSANTNAATYATNFVAKFRLKAPKYGAVPSTR